MNSGRPSTSEIDFLSNPSKESIFVECANNFWQIQAHYKDAFSEFFNQSASFQYHLGDVNSSIRYQSIWYQF